MRCLLYASMMMNNITVMYAQVGVMGEFIKKECKVVGWGIQIFFAFFCLNVKDGGLDDAREVNNGRSRLKFLWLMWYTVPCGAEGAI